MRIAWKPQPKQAIALKSYCDELLFGGARGGGKTDTGIVKPLYFIGNALFRALVLRKNATDLSDWIERAQRMYQHVGGVLVGTEFRFPSGAIIRTGHLDSKNAYQKYQGHEYQLILLEELTHIPREKDYENVRASNRSTVKDLRPMMFATTNPDGPGHEWVKARWGIPDIPGNEPIITHTESGEKRVFIPSRVHDNKILMDVDPGYVKKLESLQDEEMRRAWLDGSWEGFGVDGAYYKNQMQKVDEEQRIIKNLYDPMLPVDTWCDLGVRDSFSIGYFQFYRNEIRCIDYDEFDGEGLSSAIKRMRDKKYTYGTHHAPFDIKVRELGTGVTRWETAQGLGVTYDIVPKTGVQDGIDIVRMKLGRFVFDEKKTEVLRSRLKRYHKKEDTVLGGFKKDPVHDINSHGADMVRYCCVTKEPDPFFNQMQEIRVYEARGRDTSFE